MSTSRQLWLWASEDKRTSLTVCDSNALPLQASAQQKAMHRLSEPNPRALQPSSRLGVKRKPLYAARTAAKRPAAPQPSKTARASTKPKASALAKSKEIRTIAHEVKFGTRTILVYEGCIMHRQVKDITCCICQHEFL